MVSFANLKSYLIQHDVYFLKVVTISGTYEHVVSLHLKVSSPSGFKWSQNDGKYGYIRGFRMATVVILTFIL